MTKPIPWTKMVERNSDGMEVSVKMLVVEAYEGAVPDDLDGRLARITQGGIVNVESVKSAEKKFRAAFAEIATCFSPDISPLIKNLTAAKILGRFKVHIPTRTYCRVPSHLSLSSALFLTHTLTISFSPSLSLSPPFSHLSRLSLYLYLSL